MRAVNGMKLKASSEGEPRTGGQSLVLQNRYALLLLASGFSSSVVTSCGNRSAVIASLNFRRGGCVARAISFVFLTSVPLEIIDHPFVAIVRSLSLFPTCSDFDPSDAGKALNPLSPSCFRARPQSNFTTPSPSTGTPLCGALICVYYISRILH